MADINYKSTHGKDNWVSQTEFDGLDLSAQEEGTVYEIVGEVGESDIDSDLQTKIDAKMDAPTTSGTSGQVLTMGTDGKAKWATAGSGAKYLHYVGLKISNSTVYVWVLSTTDTQITSLQELHSAITKNKSSVTSLRSCDYPLFSRQFGGSVITVCIISRSSLQIYLADGNNMTFTSTFEVTDVVITL